MFPRTFQLGPDPEAVKAKGFFLKENVPLNQVVNFQLPGPAALLTRDLSQSRTNYGRPVDPNAKPRTLDWAHLYVEKLGLQALRPALAGVQSLAFQTLDLGSILLAVVQ